MNILWIENESAWRKRTAKIIEENVGKVNVLPELLITQSIEEIAKFINENHSTTDLIIINLNLVSRGGLRTENIGVKILKFVRLYNMNQHCIIYSFLNREQLMLLDPRNLIIFSEGVTFVRLPFDLTTLPIKEMAIRKAPENLSAYLKAETDLPDDRHFFANWFGVLQLWNIQKAVEKLAGKTIISSIEPSFSGSTKEMNSYQGLLAQYIKKIPITTIEFHLKELSAKKAEKFSNEDRNRTELQYEIKLLSDNDIECDIQLQVLKEMLTESRVGLFTKLLSQLYSFPSIIQHKIIEIQQKKNSIKNQIVSDQEYLELLELIENEKNIIYETRRKINRSINSKVSAIEQEIPFSTDRFSLEDIRKKLSDSSPSIIYVDDQANDGWAAIFQRMIYGDESSSFTVIQPDKKDSIEDISARIIEESINTSAKLIILDLRLKGEKGSITEAAQISGIKVLRKLKEAKITCPVLITTASNKVWSYKESFATGASAFWIKEGLDEKISIENSVENYLRFLDLVYVLCFSDEIKFLLNDFQKNIEEIGNANSVYWWESQFWKDKRLNYPKTSVIEKDAVCECLNQAFQLLEDYLRLKIQSLDTAKLNSNISSLIVLQCARVLEIIHKVDHQKSGVTLSDKMKDQLTDEFYNHWSKLLFMRNEVAHLFNADFGKIRNFILLLFEYLNSTISNDYIVENEKYIPQEPIAGKTYVSKILSKHPSYETYYLENPDLFLLGERGNIVLDKRFNRHLELQKLEIGMAINFELNIVEKGPKVNYFAIKSEILNH